MAQRAAIIGGSIGGLFAAAALRARGWRVTVYERSDVALAGRGAGIVTHDVLNAALEAVGADLSDLGVAITRRVAFDRDSAPVRDLGMTQIVTSWDRVFQMLRGLIPDADYVHGRQVTGYVQGPHSARVTFAEGPDAEADVIIGADGFRSAIRAQMQPRVQPVYSGYVVWRAVADEAALDAALSDGFFDVFGFYLPRGMQVIGYPIAGVGNDLRPGHRRYNLVWYKPTDAAELADCLTDAEGRHHAISIPPPLVRADVIARVSRFAHDHLPAVFSGVVGAAGRPFLAPIYDHLSEGFAEGRVALSGDAACVARPHVGMGVTKAALDALALARHLDSAPDVEAALAAYSAERVPAAHMAMTRSRRLGSYMLEGAEGTNPDGRANAHIDEIMRLTAVADFSGGA